MTTSLPNASTHRLSASGVPRGELVRHVGTAIGGLAKHLSSHIDVAKRIAHISRQAKGIAFSAWQVVVGGQNTQTIVGGLANDLTAFAEDMARLADHAGRQAVLSREVASVLASTAAKFDAIAHDPQAIDDFNVLRARLRPLVANLETIPGRLFEGNAIAVEVSKGANVASSLAARGRQICEKRKPGPMFQAVFIALNDFAVTTSKAATWVAANAEQAHRVAGTMALCVEHLADSRTTSTQETDSRRLAALIAQGDAIIW